MKLEVQVQNIQIPEAKETSSFPYARYMLLPKVSTPEVRTEWNIGHLVGSHIFDIAAGKSNLFL